MNLTITKDTILAEPVIEHTICSFASTSKGTGRINCMVDLITKKVAFKVIGNTGEAIVQDLDEAITLYNLISL